jgi:hypothetical protein
MSRNVIFVLVYHCHKLLDLKGELFIKLEYKRNMQLDYKFVVTC